MIAPPASTNPTMLKTAGTPARAHSSSHTPLGSALRPRPPCSTGQPTQACPFGVVRDGPGNAGVWIALGDGKERAILFEGGVPVSADSPEALSFDKASDLFTVRVGSETYEIPEAGVFGG